MSEIHLYNSVCTSQTIWFALLKGGSLNLEFSRGTWRRPSRAGRSISGSGSGSLSYPDPFRAAMNPFLSTLGENRPRFSKMLQAIDVLLRLIDSELVPCGEKMLYAGTDPESYITKSAFVYEDHRALRGWQRQIRGLNLPLLATHPPFPGTDLARSRPRPGTNAARISLLIDHGR